MKAIREAGLKIPQDISVVGYDGFEIGKYISPTLTTVYQDFLEMGAITVDLLFSMIEQKKEAMNIILKPKLILGESTKKSEI
ncbi:substrate-binding domain-containing protein, partial [uncultured Fusobacterium sp.]|uniref:substrate-binding domain-containing protein n=1 Tax=uncultured Fusobacterium sp. TaxID=159267 RepID=UPI0015A50BF8